jgi:hypothetical protein
VHYTAADHRPSLDDPTRLLNGAFHPQYAAWIAQQPGEQRKPWLYVTQPWLFDRLPLTSDDRLDTAKVRSAVGPRWREVLAGDHLGAKRPTWQRLAALAGVDEQDLMEHVERARRAQKEHEGIAQRCRIYPYRLQTWEELEAREPCPGCGRAWLESDSDESAKRFSGEHSACRSGQSSMSGGGPHCMRCCGVPPMSPAVRARVEEILRLHEAERLRSEQATQVADRLAQRTERRAAEIDRLERRLEKLKVEQAAELSR